MGHRRKVESRFVVSIVKNSAIRLAASLWQLRFLLATIPRMVDARPHPMAAAPPPRFTAVAERTPPSAFFVTSALFHYLGPALAVLLFARVEVLGVAWLRIASAAVLFALWRRPWRVWRASSGRQRRLLLALGAVLGAMNGVFYLAIDRLPLGTVAAIEFLGPVILAAAGVRSARNVAALAMAVSGVYLLADVHLAGEPLGLALAFGNCALFMCYVTLGHRLARDGGTTGVERLGAAMLIAMLVVAPVGAADAAAAFSAPALLAAAAGVGICSSVIPYVCDQLAMARLPRATFALMLSLLPTTAVVIGVLVLAQIPSWTEAGGVALVVAGVAVHQTRTGGNG
jgi:inner membrane transporter RhtA